jgi:hypothetical protein
MIVTWAECASANACAAWLSQTFGITVEIGNRSTDSLSLFSLGKGNLEGYLHRPGYFARVKQLKSGEIESVEAMSTVFFRIW